MKPPSMKLQNKDMVKHGVYTRPIRYIYAFPVGIMYGIETGKPVSYQPCKGPLLKNRVILIKSQQMKGFLLQFCFHKIL